MDNVQKHNNFINVSSSQILDLKNITKMAGIIFQFEYDIRTYVEETGSKGLKFFH
jgi:hypothetical protein